MDHFLFKSRTLGKTSCSKQKRKMICLDGEIVTKIINCQGMLVKQMFGTGCVSIWGLLLNLKEG